MSDSPSGDEPARDRERLIAEVAWDAEFEADLADIECVIEAAVARVPDVPGTLGEPIDAQP